MKIYVFAVLFNWIRGSLAYKKLMLLARYIAYICQTHWLGLKNKQTVKQKYVS